MRGFRSWLGWVLTGQRVAEADPKAEDRREASRRVTRRGLCYEEETSPWPGMRMGKAWTAREGPPTELLRLQREQRLGCSCSKWRGSSCCEGRSQPPQDRIR